MTTGNRMDLKERPIQSLWIGNSLSTIEQLCIKSFLKNGHQFHLYTYGKVENVPEGTTLCDASDILSLTDKYEIKSGFGAGSKAPFADVFRLNLLYKKGGWWVDMDVVCLKNFNDLPDEVIATSLEIPEGDLANINVLSFPAGNPFVNACLQEWEKVTQETLYYALGVDIVKLFVDRMKYHKHLQHHNAFNPISYRQAKYIFLNSIQYVFLLNFYRKMRGREAVEFPSRNTYSVHLWNEVLKQHNLSKNNRFKYFSYIEKLKRKFL